MRLYRRVIPLRHSVHDGIDACPRSEFDNAAIELSRELLDLVSTGHRRPYTPREVR